MNGCHIKPEQFFNLIFGYYDRYSEQTSKTSTGEATTWAYSSAVPSGEVWVIEAVECYHDDPTARKSTIRAYDGTYYIIFAINIALGQYVNLIWSGRVTLKAGDKIAIGVDSLTTGKGVIGQIWGHKMKLAQ